MIKWILSLWTFLFLQSLGAQALLDREELNKKAQEEFLSTHFFENGRGMTLSPDLAIFFGGLTNDRMVPEPLITKRYGFLPGKKQKYVGVFEVNYKGMNLAVLGCTGCHSGRAAGILIPGLGNKTIDPYRIGKDMLAVQSVWENFINDKIAKSEDYAYVHDKALTFARMLADDDISNLTRGLVPDSVIKTFFYRDTNTPYGPEIGRTQVKAPSLWGFREKVPVGVFADPSLNSENYAWAFGAELAASDSGDHLRASMPKLKHFVDNVIGNLLPPPYPFEIDPAKAAKGKVIAENTCFKCHGNHNRDSKGFPLFEAPKAIPHDKVGTDPQRLDYGNDQWVDLAEQGSVGDLIKFNRDFFNYGYYAPKLWGIWSRFPYLHNGSVPTLEDLLLPPETRPRAFSMWDAGELHRFDKKRVGLTTSRTPLVKANDLLEAKLGNRNYYYVEREEHSNQGHYFDFMEDFTNEDRSSLIEYLKTL